MSHLIPVLMICSLDLSLHGETSRNKLLSDSDMQKELLKETLDTLPFLDLAIKLEKREKSRLKIQGNNSRSSGKLLLEV